MVYDNNELIQSTKDGDFLETIYQYYMNHDGERNSVGKQLATMHNDGSIDIIDEFSRLTNTDNGDFFLTRDVLVDALPHINSPALEVMICVKHLTLEAGNDMAATMLYAPFTQFCEASTERSEEVLNIAVNSNGELLDFINLALRAGANLNLPKFASKAIELTVHENLKICASAVYALGDIDYSNNISLVLDALEALNLVIKKGYDTRVFESVLKSAFALFLADNSKELEVYNLMELALAEKNEYEIHAASELFFRETKKLPSNILDLLLNALKSTNPKNKGTLDNIDYGLQHLVKAGHIEKAFPLIEYLLISNKGELSIVLLDSLVHELLSNNEALNKLVTKWLLSKSLALGRATSDVINQRHGKDVNLRVDMTLLQGQESNSLFLARKAIGWLFTKPVSTASFIISLIDTTSEGEASEITQLLFNPLLISYPGSVKQYLIDISPELSTKSQEVITNVLGMLKRYHEGLDSARDISELWPPQFQRETYNRYFSHQMSDAHKEAEKGSVFLNLVKKSVLLYGNKSINYIYGPNEQVTRQEIPLQQISHSIEFPALENIDPHTLDYMMRVFRVEDCQ